MLIYSSDSDPGITRKGAGTGFYYLDQKGRKISNQHTIERIKSLAIPPAYTDVWICPQELGHIQATGRDARGRKQYRYHPDWQEIRNLDKFDRLIQVGHGLPRLRRKIRSDLSDFDGRKDKVVAAAVRIIDKLGYRVGNKRYLEDNGTRGISTLADHNVDLSPDGRVSIEFTGKGGEPAKSNFHDPLLQEALEECHELGGQRLFTYFSTDDHLTTIDSSDINSYLAKVFEEEVTAKDLRTWRASAETVDFLRKIKSPDDREAEIRDAIRFAAKEINNRYETCRKHYVHPIILSAYKKSGRWGFSRLRPKSIAELQLKEVILLRILDES